MTKTLLLAVFATTLQGCWFVFIPGSVVGSVTDAVTGAEGRNCVGANAKVGDRVRLLDGSIGTVKSLSGESSRCPDSRFPIRAMMVFESNFGSSGCTHRMVGDREVTECN